MEKISKEEIREAERKAVLHDHYQSDCKICTILEKIGNFICIIAIAGALLIVAYCIALRIIF